MDAAQGSTVEWIVPNAQKNRMEPILLKLEPGGGVQEEDPHEGEEFGYVLSGSVLVTLGDETYRVKKGEAFYFSASRRHGLSSKTGAVVLWSALRPVSDGADAGKMEKTEERRGVRHDEAAIDHLVDISKQYDGTTVLDQLNLEIFENQFVTLLGPSGCGKPPLCGLSGGLRPRMRDG